jgi:hypothetical protein
MCSKCSVLGASFNIFCCVLFLAYLHHVDLQMVAMSTGQRQPLGQLSNAMK